MSKLAMGLICLLLAVALLPFVLVANSRARHSPNEEIHLMFDMDNQPRYDPQAASPVFADGRSMRPQPPGTVAREDLQLHNETLNDNDDPRPVGGKEETITFTDPSTYAAVTLGRVRPAAMTDEQFAALRPPADDKALAADKTFYERTIPSQIPVTSDLVHRGQERFTIYCSPCHGQSGYGDGMVDQRAHMLQQAGADGTQWTTPQNLHEPKILARPDGSIFNTITNGARTMPPYDKQISIMDRWAIVAYVRVLQRAQQAQPSDLAAAAPLQSPTAQASAAH